LISEYGLVRTVDVEDSHRLARETLAGSLRRDTHHDETMVDFLLLYDKHVATGGVGFQPSK
jgi:hypothetical protein